MIRRRVCQNKPLGCGVALGVSLALAVMLWASPSSAQESALRVGANAGYASVTLPELVAGGYGGGVQLSYGITDAFNLRAHGDVSIYALPEADSLLLWGSGVGAEYLLDVIDWVPYAGLMVGPANAAFQVEGGAPWLLSVEIPFGLGYRVVPELMLSAEGRYRLLFLGGEGAPTSQLWLSARIEYVWEPAEE